MINFALSQIITRVLKHPRLSSPVSGQMFTGVLVTEKYGQIFTGSSNYELYNEDGIIIGGEPFQHGNNI